MQELERQLALAKAEVNRLEITELPAAFTEDGLSELRLPSGPGARRDMTVRGSLPAEEPRHGRGLIWLTETGYEENIRSMVTANYGREQRERAQQLYETLRGDNTAFTTLTETIHHSTLRAIGLERARAGQPVDWENLGLTLIRRVTLTRPPTHHVSTEEQDQ